LDNRGKIPAKGKEFHVQIALSVPSVSSAECIGSPIKAADCSLNTCRLEVTNACGFDFRDTHTFMAGCLGTRVKLLFSANIFEWKMLECLAKIKV
jgi:hypothetical protein